MAKGIRRFDRVDRHVKVVRVVLDLEEKFSLHNPAYHWRAWISHSVQNSVPIVSGAARASCDLIQQSILCTTVTSLYLF